MTPEQKIFNQLKRTFAKYLPKGRWMLQRIETSTGTGILDTYCSIFIPLSNANNHNVKLWLETKTTEYKVSNEQLNWASSAWLTGTASFVVTLAQPGQNMPKTTAKNTPCAPIVSPTISSNPLTHTNPANTNYEHLVGAYNTIDLSSTYASLSWFKQTKAPVEILPGPGLILLAFDERMRDCTSLGVYLRRFNPPYFLVSKWLETFRLS